MIYQSYTGTQSDLTQVMTLNKKVKAQPLSSITQTVTKFESEL